MINIVIFGLYARIANIYKHGLHPLNEICYMGTVISLGDRYNQLSAQNLLINYLIVKFDFSVSSD